MATFSANQNVYLEDGHLCIYVADLGAGQHAVRKVYEIDGEPWVSDKITTAAVFAEPPAAKLDGRIAERQAKLAKVSAALADSARSVQVMEGRAKALEAAARAQRPVALLAAWIAGTITHYVLIDYSSGPRLRPAAEACPSGLGSKCWRKPNGFSVEFTRDGYDRVVRFTIQADGCDKNSVVPCLSAEEAEATLRSEWDIFWARAKNRQWPYHAKIAAQRSRDAGIRPPDWALEKIATEARASAIGAVEYAKTVLAKAEAALAALDAQEAEQRGAE